MHTHAHDTHRITQRAILLPIILSLGLVILKGFGWNETGSVSLLSSFLDSGMDILVSGMNLAAVSYAAKPADDDHRYGHTSIEDIVGLVQASFIVASALFLFYEATHRFLNPSEVQAPEFGMGVMAVSIIAPLVVVLFQRVAMRKSQSLVLKADSLHYLTDVLMNGSILVSIYIASRPGWGIIDPLLALAVAAYILHSAYEIGRRAFDHLMDREVPPETYTRIAEIINTHPGVIGCHRLRTRMSGSKIFMQMHLDVDASLNLKTAHDIADALEAKLEEAFDDAEVIIHIDPKEICASPAPASEIA